MNKDQQVVAVVYEWKSGRAYMKKGIDLSNNKSDSKVNPGFTTFIKASVQVQMPKPLVVQPVQQTVGFIKLNGDSMTLDNNPFVAVGSNAYWLGLTEEYSYPSKQQIEEMFIAVSRMGGNTIRSHTLGHSSGSPNSLRPKDNNLNEKAWDSIDYSFSMARKYNIKIIAPLTDGYNWYNGNYGDFCITRGVPKKDFWTNKEVRNDFKDYINKYLNHYNTYNKCLMKDDPSLGIIELGNELGNIRDNHNSLTIPTNEWLTDISKYIKSIDPNHLILNPADECLGQSNEFSIQTIDTFGAHFYWNDTQRLDTGIVMSRRANKPYIVGEYSSFSDESWYKLLENRKVKGSLFWSMYPQKNGIFGGEKILHTDGYTIHYTKDNEKFLLLIAQHFCRLRGIPEIKSLDFGKYVPNVTPTPSTTPSTTPPTPSWNSANSYIKGERTIYNGVEYECLIGNFNQQPGVWAPVTMPKPPVPVVLQNIPSKPLPQTPVNLKLTTLLNGKSPIGTYYQSWSANWASDPNNLDLSKIEPPINIVNISFCYANCTYQKGSYSWEGTGLAFSSDFSTVKKSIEILKSKGVIVMLSVGGATYPFTFYRPENVAYLCEDLGCNGIDIDWEDEHGFERFGEIISVTKKAYPNGCISCAGFSVGAYGEGNFKNSQPGSPRTGMNIQGLKSDGKYLDWINIMTYDASPVFNPIEAFKAYRSFYSGPLLIGEEVPPEAWGGNVITLEKVKEHSEYVKSQGRENGIFTWSYQKPGTPSSKEILATAARVLQ
jgi:mannan endo-1,4-beta-mannosidase